MSLGEGNDVLPVDDEGAGQGETPAVFGGVVVVESGVVERDVDEDGLEVSPLFGGDGVSDTELLCDPAACVGQQRKGQRVLIAHKDILPGGLRGDGDQKRTTTTKLAVEIAPGLEFRDAVRAPAATEEFEYDGAKSDEVGRVDLFAGAGVGKRKRRRLRAGLEDAVFNTGCEEFSHRLLGEGEAFGLDEGAGVLGDAVELVLQRGFQESSHTYIIAATSVVG